MQDEILYLQIRYALCLTGKQQKIKKKREEIHKNEGFPLYFFVDLY